MYSKSKLQMCFIALTLFTLSISANAQCAMCRAALGGDSNKAQAQAVNDGIVYLMVIPYILVAAIGYAVYKMRKKKVT
jgi:triphosphoribosyl-dephospho-CoA synthetase